MSAFKVDTNELVQVGGDLQRVARGMGALSHLVGGASGVADPAQTAEALADLAAAWGAAAPHLAEDLENLGGALNDAAFLYETTDAEAIPRIGTGPG